ncbi:MAG: nucleoside recognition domain-containing protein [Candidatus Thermoplasmatota archaeon]|nr:nucleoside recognition domain-containing protein [Candidatus Thermoplasmatota archaeon]
MIAFPLIIAGSFILTTLKMLGLLTQLNNVLSPVTMSWLGLPAVVGSVLIFGILRKELTPIMLATFMPNFALVLTPVQILTFTIITMFYISLHCDNCSISQRTKMEKKL